jgi:hypothetical protein
MSIQITVRNLAVLRIFFKNKVNSDEPEAQKFFFEARDAVDALHFNFKEEMEIIKECINTLQYMKNEETSNNRKEKINSVIKKLQQLNLS